MTEINEMRKELTAKYLRLAEQTIADCGLGHDVPLVVVQDGIPEGLIGIIAGSLREKYRVPTFVLTRQRGQAELLKGSGRAGTGDGEDLAPVLDAIRPLCVSCGGHAGAAGLSLKADNLDKVKSAMQKAVAGLHRQPQTAQVQYYDLEINAEDIPEVYQELSAFAPFGQGVPKPVILVRGYQTAVRFGSHFRTIGKERDSVKINGEQSDIFAYKMSKQYLELNAPRKLDVLCTIEDNTYNGRTTIQLHAMGLRTAA